MSTSVKVLSRHLTDEEIADQIVELRDYPPKGISSDFAREMSSLLRWELRKRCKAHLELFDMQRQV